MAQKPREIRDREEADTWLGSGLCLQRLGMDLPTVIPWLVATVSEAGSLPPAGIVADLGALASGKTFELGQALAVSEPRLRAAVQAYEEQVLGRLSCEARLEAIVDAVAKLPAELRKSAVALLVGKLVERTGFRLGTAMSPAVVRRLSRRDSAEILKEGHAGLRGAGAEKLALAYEELVRGARATGTLFGDADVFALENLAVLGSLNQRVAVEQMVEVAEELSNALPRRLRKRASAQGAVHTQVEDESTYPIGGFASMSTAGSMENLVCSELIYMEDGEAGEVDLFDMRYTEQELLYYTRDESVFVRSRRVITFAILPDLIEARFLDAGSRWQRIVMVFGMILCAVRRLSYRLSEEGLLFRVVFIADDKKARRTPLAEELDLCRLLLGEWIEKGVAEVVEAPALAGVMTDASERARRAQCMVIAVSQTNPFEAAGKGDPRVRRGALLIGATPRLVLEAATSRPGDEEEGFRAWTQTALELLQESA